MHARLKLGAGGVRWVEAAARGVSARRVGKRNTCRRAQTLGCSSEESRGGELLYLYSLTELAIQPSRLPKGEERAQSCGPSRQQGELARRGIATVETDAVGSTTENRARSVHAVSDCEEDEDAEMGEGEGEDDEMGLCSYMWCE